MIKSKWFIVTSFVLMLKKFRSFGLYTKITVTCCFMLVFSSVLQASPSNGYQLLEKVSGDEKRLPIIVQFNSLERSDKSSVTDLRNAIQSKQRSIVGRLSKNTTVDKRVKVFERVPQMALSASRSDLKTLLADPTLTIWEDTLKKPQLAQSVARVYPGQKRSIYTGDNRWAVAVLDSGVDTSHPFLSGKLLSEACYSDGGGQPGTVSLCPGGATSSTATGSGQDCNIAGCQHGTQVAGVAVGKGSPFNGVAPNAKLISIQVYSRVNDEGFCFPELSCLGAYTSDIIAGLERVYALRNTYDIAAANVSLGSSETFSGTCDDQPEKPIIDLLKAAKIAVVASTGNGGNTSRMQAPACISSTIAVAATFDTSETPWVNNNTSNALDFYAPGVNIESSTPGGGFASGTGTSLAAPHVAGAWAVLRHADPTLSVNAIQSLLASNGPVVTQNTVSRRRVEVAAVLRQLFPNEVSEIVVPPFIMLLLLDD